MSGELQKLCYKIRSKDKKQNPLAQLLVCLKKEKSKNKTLILNSTKNKVVVKSWPGWPFLLRQCSRTCGGGVQKRDVLCKQRMADGSFLELPETFCSASKPTSQQACKKDDCPSEWLLSDWSEVGLLLRRKECKSWTGREITQTHA